MDAAVVAILFPQNGPYVANLWRLLARPLGSDKGRSANCHRVTAREETNYRQSAHEGDHENSLASFSTLMLDKREPRAL